MVTSKTFQLSCPDLAHSAWKAIQTRDTVSHANTSSRMIPFLLVQTVLCKQSFTRTPLGKMFTIIALVMLGKCLNAKAGNLDITDAQPVARAPLGSLITVAVDRYGSICTAPTSKGIAPMSSSTINYANVSASGATVSTPMPTLGTTIRCTDPICPALNHGECVDSTGIKYAVSCNATIHGAVAFPPSMQRRKYETSFTDCLLLCDSAPYCRGVSYSMSNCLLYGPIGAVVSQNGSIAATKIYNS